MAQTQILANGTTAGEASAARIIAAGGAETLYCTGVGGVLVVMAGGRSQASFTAGVQLNGPLTYTVVRSSGNCGCMVES